jgi:hypothetical protein
VRWIEEADELRAPNTTFPLTEPSDLGESGRLEGLLQVRHLGIHRTHASEKRGVACHGES